VATTETLFAVGLHRPVYFWGGPTTVMMNRLKFMDAPVNESVHLEAHTARAARRLADAGFNWAYLMYNWGFPPEQDAVQWGSFRRAVDVFHRAGLRVFGYVQLSNCVYAGSHVEEGWYARDPRGRFIHYYTGRYMTCWLHPAWREQLARRVREVVEAGADGVFLDNPWMGLHPLSLFDTWVTGAGCYCDRCQAAYGRSIPEQLDPQHPDTQQYLTWRTGVVWQLIGELADLARSLRPTVVVAENVYDAINCNHYAEFGVDLRAAARVSDVVMIEDHSFPRLAADGAPVVNSITCKAARAWSGGRPVTTDPYIAGIGFDPVYTPRQFQRAVAEGAACGATTIVKGTEFFDPRDGGFTLLTGEPFGPEREALAQIHRWLEAHADLYADSRPASPLAVYFPYDALPFDWRYAAPLTFAACQALLVDGLPYRIVGPGPWVGVEALILPPGQSEGLVRQLAEFTAAGGRAIALGEERPGAELVWARERPATPVLQRHPGLCAAFGRGALALFRAYFSHRLFRGLLDRTHVTQRVLQGGAAYNPLFRVPPLAERAALRAALGGLVTPRIEAERSVLIEWWRRGDIEQLHLVNYADHPQPVTVHLPWAVSARLLSPDAEETVSLIGRSLKLSLDVYTVLVWEGGACAAD